MSVAFPLCRAQSRVWHRLAGTFWQWDIPSILLRLQIPLSPGSSSGFVRKSQMGELCDPGAFSEPAWAGSARKGLIPGKDNDTVRGRRAARVPSTVHCLLPN